MTTDARYTTTRIHEPPGLNDVLPQRTTEDHIEGIHDLLHDLLHFLQTSRDAEAGKDVFKIVTLYKIGSGPNWVPSPNEYSNMYVMATAATAVDVDSPLGAVVSVTIPAVTPPDFWNHWDWPDGTSFRLNALAPASAMNIWVRLTNKES